MESNAYLCCQYNTTALNKINNHSIFLHLRVCVCACVYTFMYFIYTKNCYEQAQVAKILRVPVPSMKI